MLIASGVVTAINMNLALLVAGQLVLAMFAITFVTYTGDLIPGINQTLVAFAILTICYIMNVLVVLLVAMGSFIVFGMSNGLIGFFTGASLLTFATGGAEFLSELGGEMKNPGKDLPRAMIFSTGFVAIIYVFIGIVAADVSS